MTRRQAAEEERAEDGAEDRPDAADDDDRDELDREEQAPLVRGDVLLVGAVERAGQPPRRRSRRRTRRPCSAPRSTPMISAATSRSRIACIARPGRVRTMFLASSAHERDEPPDQPEPALVADVLVAEDRDGVEVERPERDRRPSTEVPGVAAGEPLEVAEQVLAEEHQPERHDRQVVAAQAQRERADRARRRAAPNSAAAGSQSEQRQAELAADVRRPRTRRTPMKKAWPSETWPV